MKQTRLAWNVILSHLTSVKTKSQEKDGKKEEEEIFVKCGWVAYKEEESRRNESEVVVLL